MASPQLHTFPDGSKVQSAVIDFVLAAAKSSIADHGHFSVGFSGGSVSKILSLGLRDRQDVDWPNWHIFYCDERHVPFANEDSTHAYFKKELYDKVPAIKNVYAINPDVDVNAAAEDYVAKIRQLYPGTDVPSFDLLLLGMGPDGHTCSLFPNHPGLKEEKKIVIPITDSPKPPPSRITLTIPVLNSAKRVAVISTGGSKADAVRACLKPDAGKEPLPAGRARPTNGELHWFMDEPAASKL